MARLQINYWAETLSNHRHLTVLLPDLTESALLPYVGEARATAQRKLLLEGHRPTAG